MPLDDTGRFRGPWPRSKVLIAANLDPLANPQFGCVHASNLTGQSRILKLTHYRRSRRTTTRGRPAAFEPVGETTVNPARANIGTVPVYADSAFTVVAGFTSTG
jgi:hypothetical protein